MRAVRQYSRMPREAVEVSFLQMFTTGMHSLEQMDVIEPTFSRELDKIMAEDSVQPTCLHFRISLLKKKKKMCNFILVRDEYDDFNRQLLLG